jgi:hypothetical protein
VLGCGTKSRTPGEIKGVVKYNGQLVKGGTIRFQSNDEGTYGGSIHEDGSYSVVEVAPGDMVVTIETESANPEIETPVYDAAQGVEGAKSPQAMMDKRRQAGMQVPGSASGPEKKRENYVKIPAKYGDPNQSGLKVTVGKGTLTKDFDLTD